jgi:phage RecT family recombinase
MSTDGRELMSTARNEIVQRTPAQQLVARVRDTEVQQEIAKALPPTVTLERFTRVTTTALLANPDIAKLDPNSVLRALIQSAAAGLIPDGREAAIVGRGGQAVFQPMIWGYVKTAAEFGWTLRTKAVYENDDFSYTEEPPNLHHQPVRPGAERGELVAAYAIATHKDGRRLQRVMHPEDIAKRRAQATTQNVWNKWPAEMWEKTAGRDLFQDLPLADSDLERDRIKRLLSEGELLTDPAVSLYGPKIEGTSHEAAVPPADRTLPSSQQAGDVGLSAAAPASPAPDLDRDDEPDIDSPAGFNTPPGVAEDETVVAAQHAAQFTIPNGKHRGVALGELLDKDGGQTWLAWALAHISEPPEYVSALFAFSRVFAPELFQAELARREAA